MSKPIEEWIENPKGHKSDAWIDAIYSYYLDGDHWLSASIKFDGCIHFNKAYNSPFPKIKSDDQDQDNIHICSIDDFIKQLMLLKEYAKKHFGEEWPS